MAEAHPKGVLLERAQKLGLSRPEFRTERTGPEHEPSFISDAIVAGEVLGTGQGGSKRTAEKNAAQEALMALDEREAAAKPEAAAPKGKNRRSRSGKTAKEASEGAASAPTKSSAASRTASTQPQPTEELGDDASEPDVDDAPFTGPWPMFDDLLAAVLGVAERRVSVELRGDAARVAIRDFSLTLYKELLSDLGEVVEEEDDEEDED